MLGIETNFWVSVVVVRLDTKLDFLQLLMRDEFNFFI